MSKSLTLAALLSTALLVGCGDRATTDREDFEQDRAEAPVDPAPAPGAGGDTATQAPPQQDSPAARTDTPAARTPAPRPQAQTPAAGGQAAPPAPRQQTPAVREVSLPVGTALPLELMTALSSETSQVETQVRARLRQAVMVDDAIVLPAGTVLTGTVIEAQRAGRVQGRARLSFRFDSAELDGERQRIATNPITFEAQGSVGDDAATVGAGAVGGAVIGSILGGGSGAARGAAIGGAAGAGVVLATRGDEVQLSQGTAVAATLAQPFQTRVRTQ